MSDVSARLSAAQSRTLAVVPGGVLNAAMWCLDRVAVGLIALGVTANGITIFSVVLAAAAGGLLAFGYFGMAAVAMVIASLGDALDGLVARRTGTAFGRGRSSMPRSTATRSSSFSAAWRSTSGACPGALFDPCSSARRLLHGELRQRQGRSAWPACPPELHAPRRTRRMPLPGHHPHLASSVVCPCRGALRVGRADPPSAGARSHRRGGQRLGRSSPAGPRAKPIGRGGDHRSPARPCAPPPVTRRKGRSGRFRPPAPRSRGGRSPRPPLALSSRRRPSAQTPSPGASPLSLRPPSVLSDRSRMGALTQ